MQPSDRELTQKAKKGDRRSFEALYLKYRKNILNYIYRITGKREVAEELTQETFVKVYMNLPNYQERDSFRAWLYTIAGNLVKNELRSRTYRQGLSLEEPLTVDKETLRLIDTIADKTADPDLIAQKHELHRAIQKVLNSLSTEHRAMLVLCDIEGLAYKEAGRILRINVGTVASRLSRAREEFNKKLRIEYDLDRDVI